MRSSNPSKVATDLPVDRASRVANGETSRDENNARAERVETLVGGRLGDVIPAKDEVIVR